MPVGELRQGTPGIHTARVSPLPGTTGSSAQTQCGHWHFRILSSTVYKALVRSCELLHVPRAGAVLLYPNYAQTVPWQAPLTVLD